MTAARTAAMIAAATNSVPATGGKSRPLRLNQKFGLAHSGGRNECFFMGTASLQVFLTAGKIPCERKLVKARRRTDRSFLGKKPFRRWKKEGPGTILDR